MRCSYLASMNATEHEGLSAKEDRKVDAGGQLEVCVTDTCFLFVRLLKRSSWRPSGGMHIMIAPVPTGFKNPR